MPVILALKLGMSRVRVGAAEVRRRFWNATEAGRIYFAYMIKTLKVPLVRP